MNPLARFSLAAAALAACGASQAQNYPSSSPAMPMPTSCARLEISTHGRALPKIPFRSQLWVEGRDGSEYTLSVVNDCPFRTLAILSVDGLNVLNGKTADFSQTGYVIAPYGRAEIPGWRKSDNQVAAFYFTYPGDSYAQRVGKGGNIGVIGAAFFQENAPPPMMMEKSAPGMEFDSAMRSAPRAMAAPAPSLGTGHGRQIDNRVESTRFDRQNSPFLTVQIRYESRENLVAMGAIRREPRREGPNAFPGQEPTYAPDPPNNFDRSWMK